MRIWSPPHKSEIVISVMLETFKSGDESVGLSLVGKISAGKDQRPRARASVDVVFTIRVAKIKIYSYIYLLDRVHNDIRFSASTELIKYGHVIVSIEGNHCSFDFLNRYTWL